MVLALEVVGGLMYSGGSDCTIREWDLKTTDCTKVFKGHMGYVQCLAFCDGILYPPLLLL